VDAQRNAAEHASRKEVDDTAEKITAFLGGADVSFDLEIIDMGPLPAFQKRVLLAEYEIPRGRVSTYGRIAARVGTPKDARAVGRALACNPFPVIIPCHRAITSRGGLGGFQGGTAMKKRLLVNEGVQFIGEDRVSTSDLYY
jgi:methylated-DNA-[protein]-cysteine S-methyltransferase